MSRKPTTIDINELLDFYPKLKARELTQSEVAAHFGVSRDTLRNFAKKANQPLPSVRSHKPLAQRLLELYTIGELQAMSQYKIATELNIQQPNVCKAFKELGIKSARGRCPEKTAANCRIICDYIIKNGGWVKSTIRKLGIALDKASVYAYARREGIDLKQYGFAYRAYGNWLTLPCHAKRVSASDHLLLAECQLCGNVYEVRRINLVTGASTSCRNCSHGASGGHQKVRCKDTGEIFPSIRAWASSVESPVRYQSLRLRIKQTGECSIKGKTYELIVTEDS